MCCVLQPLKTEVFNFPWCSRSWRFGQESSTGDNRHQHTLSVHVCSSVCKLTPFIARNATMAQVGTILRSKLASAVGSAGLLNMRGNLRVNAEARIIG
jgi:hypothetical protein